MVNLTEDKLSRRKILRMSGAGMAAATGSSAIGSAVATSQDNQPEKAHRANNKEQNKPKFAENKKIGFSKGGFDKPVTSDTIRTLYSEVIGNHLGKERIALPKPAKKEKGPRKEDQSANKIMGIVVSVNSGETLISVDRRPVGIDSPNNKKKKNIESRLHKKIDERARKHEKNQNDSNKKGD